MLREICTKHTAVAATTTPAAYTWNADVQQQQQRRRTTLSELKKGGKWSSTHRSEHKKSGPCIAVVCVLKVITVKESKIRGHGGWFDITAIATS